MKPLSELADRIVQLSRPAIVGVAGAVAVGKTTIAIELADKLGATVVSTDAFLLSNQVLAQRDLLMRKGFPETYDADAMAAAMHAMKHGEQVALPVYSHAVYDIVPGDSVTIERADFYILEGVVALQHYARPHLDFGIYVEAPEDVVRGWFIDRFLRFTDAARTDESSFYRMFVDMDADSVRSIAEATWDGINGVNLLEHIGPCRAHADVLVVKGSDHAVAAIGPPA